jgi:beta-lactam-binding protein with PASTA domain
MSIIKFLISKTFLKQIALALVAVVVLCFIILKWLNVSTNHGEFETVPDLTGKSISVAQIELKENNLVMQIQDSANFNPDYPKFSVIEQEPPSGAKVKENRKILVPDLKEKTFRQAKPTLEALGFKVGKITYQDNIGKDLVLKMTHKGSTINEGDELAKTSVIDLVLGNGNRP